MNALNPLIVGKLKKVSGSPDHEIDALGHQCAQCFLHQQAQSLAQQRALLFFAGLITEAPSLSNNVCV